MSAGGYSRSVFLNCPFDGAYKPVFDALVFSEQDIHAHGNDARRAVGEVRAWLRTATGRVGIPGGQEIWSRYLTFRRALPGIGRKAKLRPEEWTFVDYTHAVWEWTRLHS